MASKANAQSEIKDIEKMYNITVDSVFLEATPYKQYDSNIVFQPEMSVIFETLTVIH